MFLFWLTLALLLALWAAGSLPGLLVMVLLAGMVAYVANVLLPGHQLDGWLALTAAGLVGSALGLSLVEPIGPDLAGVAILPALVGAVMVILGLATLRQTW